MDGTSQERRVGYKVRNIPDACSQAPPTLAALAQEIGGVSKFQLKDVIPG
jgi:hypothetical protein